MVYVEIGVTKCHLFLVYQEETSHQHVESCCSLWFFRWSVSSNVNSGNETYAANLNLMG